MSRDFMDLKTLIESGDIAGLQRLLTADPSQANAPIQWGTNCEITSRPLHFLCDKVFDATLFDETAARLARVLVDAGADIDDRDGDPLNAAASLGATGVGLVLLEAGARLDGRGLFGESALHWAANIGDTTLVHRLLEQGAPVDVEDDKYQSTPLGWALHGWGETPPPGDHGHHREVVTELVRAGAVVRPEWLSDALAKQHAEMIAALQGL